MRPMFPLARFRVEQRSMSPVLEPGDYVLVNTWAYKFHPPQVGDLVVFTDPERPGRSLAGRSRFGHVLRASTLSAA